MPARCALHAVTPESASDATSAVPEQVQTLLTQLVRLPSPTRVSCELTAPSSQNTTFTDMSSTILTRIDDLGARIDDVERGASSCVRVACVGIPTPRELSTEVAALRVRDATPENRAPQ